MCFTRIFIVYQGKSVKNIAIVLEDGILLMGQKNDIMTKICGISTSLSVRNICYKDIPKTEIFAFKL